MFSALLPLAALAHPTWTMVHGGDVMLNGIAPARLPLKGIESTLRSADIALLNLEIPLTNSRTVTKRKSAAELKRRDQFVLKADPQHINGLRRAGVDLVSLGNNHALDYGPTGLDEMACLLQDAKIGFTGAGSAASAYRPAVSDCAPRKVALISALAFMSPGALGKCTPATAAAPGVAVLSFGGVIGDAAREKIARWVGTARKRADVVVVGLHWGIEKQTLPTPYQVALGRAFVDAGADLVWGNHPHVLQGAELYKEKPIFYSMGNLVSPTPAESALARLRYSGKKLTGVEWLPTRIRGGRVELLEKKEQEKALKRIDGLSVAFRKRYPSIHSQPLPTVGARPASPRGPESATPARRQAG